MLSPRLVSRAGSLLRRHRRRLPMNYSPSALSSTSAAAAPPPSSSSHSVDINRLVEDISSLTLLQTADLVSLLKSRLNIQEIALPTSAPAAAPSTAQTTLDESEAQEQAKPKEKTIFNVKIESFDPAAKPKIIREVKAQVPNLNLMEAKKFVESVPKVVKENLPKEDAEKLKAAFEALGAKVVLE